MSGQETLTGYIKPFPRIGSGCDEETDQMYFERVTGQDWATKNYLPENLEDAIGYYFYDDYVVIDNTIFEVYAKEVDDDGCYCHMQQQEDGSISFSTSFYNGGTCLAEMLQDSYNNRKLKQSDDYYTPKNKTEDKNTIINFYNETMDHQDKVRRNINKFVTRLLSRGVTHDRTKYSEEERDLFIKMTPLLKVSTYGSEEYKEFLDELKPALDHHYANNTHHPENHKDGIKGMTLVDLVEMFCDWKAAAERHSDGDIRKSIDINQERFGYSDELKQILINTILKEM